MKGVIISFDAVISLIITFTLLLVIMSFFAESSFSSLNDVKLSAVSEDVLTVLEKSGKLEQAVKENKNQEIGKYLNKTSKNLCFEVNLFDFDDSSSALSSATKKGCNKTQGNLLISTKRSFTVNEKIYWAEMKSWYQVK